MIMKILSHKLEELPKLKYNTLITVECDYCHKSFQKERKIIGRNINRGSKHLFCNPKCLSEFRKIAPKKQNNILKVKFIRNKNFKVKVIQPFISKTVKYKYNCVQCKKEILRTEYELSKKKNKNGLVFCSRSCRMTHQNLNNPKKYSCRKSKAEIYLFELIKRDFPNLIVLENDRTILKSKLEIDLFIPEFKLAIELNGPVHYLPIYGEDRLKKCQNRDLLKQQEIHQIGLALIAIDISRLNSKKKTQQFLDEYYISHIKPILNGSGSEN